MPQIESDVEMPRVFSNRKMIVCVRHNKRLNIASALTMPHRIGISTISTNLSQAVMPGYRENGVYLYYMYVTSLSLDWVNG